MNGIKEEHTAGLILRWGLAFVLLYESFLTLRYGYGWNIYFPRFVTDVLVSGKGTIITILAITQILLAIWLVWGRRAEWAALFIGGAVLLAALFNLDNLDMLYRDVGLGVAAFALFVLLKR
jgi:hypothetical protein